jgi:DNA polymerase IV
LAQTLERLCQRLEDRLKQAELGTTGVTLKLKTADFRLRTRSRRLAEPTQLAATLYVAALHLLAGEVDGVTRFRLIGIGADAFVEAAEADMPMLFDANTG